jgi:hypothetical protein
MDYKVLKIVASCIKLRININQEKNPMTEENTFDSKMSQWNQIVKKNPADFSQLKSAKQ